MAKNKWYIAGLHFECQQCGSCCSGPHEGFIWVTKTEIELIADFLRLSTSEVRTKFIKRFAFRTTIIEHAVTKDCIFLKEQDGQKICEIYAVRPNQCRMWPFWPSNLPTQNAWNKAAQRCPGINKGRLYSFEQIQKLRKQKKWWNDDR